MFLTPSAKKALKYKDTQSCVCYVLERGPNHEMGHCCNDESTIRALMVMWSVCGGKKEEKGSIFFTSFSSTRGKATFVFACLALMRACVSSLLTHGTYATLWARHVPRVCVREEETLHAYTGKVIRGKRTLLVPFQKKRGALSLPLSSSSSIFAWNKQHKLHKDVPRAIARSSSFPHYIKTGRTLSGH